MERKEVVKLSIGALRLHKFKFINRLTSYWHTMLIPTMQLTIVLQNILSWHVRKQYIAYGVFFRVDFAQIFCRTSVIYSYIVYQLCAGATTCMYRMYSFCRSSSIEKCVIYQDTYFSSRGSFAGWAGFLPTSHFWHREKQYT